MLLVAQLYVIGAGRFDSMMCDIRGNNSGRLIEILVARDRVNTSFIPRLSS